MVQVWPRGPIEMVGRGGGGEGGERETCTPIPLSFGSKRVTTSIKDINYPVHAVSLWARFGLVTIYESVTDGGETQHSVTAVNWMDRMMAPLNHFRTRIEMRIYLLPPAAPMLPILR
jgi:hypothetical protein